MPSPSQPTKAERREAAREKARELREAQARREQRTRTLIIVGVLVLIVVVALALWAIVNQGSKSVIDRAEALPANVSTEDGGISLGSDLVAGTSNEGAPVVDVYLDYTCGYCAQFEELNGADLTEAVAAGDATVVYHPVAILDRTGDFSGFSGRSAEAAAVVADGAPERFNEVNTALFTLWAEAQAGGTEPTEDQIAAAVLAAGVPQEVADRIPQDTFTDWVAATTEQFGRDGFTGTPTVLVDGEEFPNWIEPGALMAELGR